MKKAKFSHAECERTQGKQAKDKRTLNSPPLFQQAELCQSRPLLLPH
jgi:hypothetical protein